MGGTLGISGVYERIEDAGRRSEAAAALPGVGVPGPPNDFRPAGPGVVVPAVRPPPAPPILGRAVLVAFGVIPELSPPVLLLAVLAPSFVGLDEPPLALAVNPLAAEDWPPSRIARRSFAVRFK